MWYEAYATIAVLVNDHAYWDAYDGSGKVVAAV
jgi:hypothetical protein